MIGHFFHMNLGTRPAGAVFQAGNRLQIGFQCCKIGLKLRYLCGAVIDNEMIAGAQHFARRAAQRGQKSRRWLGGGGWTRRKMW